MLERFSQLLRHYIELRLEIFKVDLQDQTQKLLAKALVGFWFLFLGSAFLLFTSFALAFYLNEILESKFLGFLIIGITFLLILAVSIALDGQKKLTDWVKKYFRTNE
jgi:hypothetical protein